MNGSKAIKAIKATAFSLIFILLFLIVSHVLTVSSSDLEYHRMTGIYNEPESSLDAVYIGSSNCYAFWNQLLAWEEYGIAVYPYTCSSMPLMVTEYMIREARKTQPDALYIVNINTLEDSELNDVVMHRLLDYMPLSSNKLELTRYMSDTLGYSFTERLEFYFPILRYHSRWNELTAYNFTDDYDSLKSSSQYPAYLISSTDISDVYQISKEEGEISDALSDSLDRLLNYCTEEKVKVLFVAVPRAEEKAETVQKINTVKNIISEKGFDVLDLMDKTDQIGLDLKTDYYNRSHTNIHGSIKYTHYLSKYLVEKYGFEDKRSNVDYVSWNEALDKYMDVVDSYILNFETDPQHHDSRLSAPGSLTADAGDSVITVEWERVKGAEGYAVYKKIEKNGAWKQVTVTDELVFKDTVVSEDKTYYYTVAPYYVENGQRYYGDYLYNGVSTTL